MTIELGHLSDGRLILASDEAFPADVMRVEYYREQRLFMVIYEEGADHDGDLMPCEVSPELAETVKSSARDIVIAMTGNPAAPYGYEVPLIQVGV